MNGGNNSIYGGRVLYTANDAIVSSGTGCMTVSGVEVLQSRRKGMYFDHSGTIKIVDSQVIGSADWGIHTDQKALCVSVYNSRSIAGVNWGLYTESYGDVDIRYSEFSANNNWGLHVELVNNAFAPKRVVLVDTMMVANDDYNARFINSSSDLKLTVEVHGTVSSIGSRDRGFNVEENTEIQVWGDLIVFGNHREGLYLDDGAGLVIAEDGYLESCSNTQEDVSKIGDGPLTIDGTLVCGVPDTGITCSAGCTPVETALVCEE